MSKIKKKYSKHLSPALNNLFKNRSFQGQDPSKAKIIFLGLDANFAPGIEDSVFFPSISEYLIDGVKFWENHHIHHPFLLPNFSMGDGVTYHKRFSKLNLSDSRAKDISFCELLDFPTCGNTSLRQLMKWLNEDHDHIKKLDDILQSTTNKKAVYIARGTYHILYDIGKKYDCFRWLPEPIKFDRNKLYIISDDRNLKVCVITHFSDAISDDHIMEIKRTI